MPIEKSFLGENAFAVAFAHMSISMSYVGIILDRHTLFGLR